MAVIGTLIHMDMPVGNAQYGEPVAVKHLMPEKSVHFDGFGAGTLSLATVQILGSNDNVNWVQLGSNVSDDGVVSITTPIAFLRLYKLSETSGTQTAVLCGYGPEYTA